MEAVIRIEALQKTYKSGFFGGTSVDAVKGVSLEVTPGQVFGLLGPNGAGKTTIIKMLVGLIRPTAGAAYIFGDPIGSQAVSARIGYLPEHHRFPEYLTGREVLDYFGRLSGMTHDQLAAARGPLLDRVGMTRWAGTKLRSYSKGMVQRLGLAQAMIHDPDVLFLDEPTDGVDPVGRAEIRGILSDLRNDNKTIFLNSHLLQEIELISDRVAILTKGEILKTGTVKEITSRRPQTRLRISEALGERREAVEKAVELELGEETAAADGDGHEVEFTVPSEDHAKVDALVDQLRAAGLSIRAMIPERLTLEDAFIEAVGGRQVGGDVVGDTQKPQKPLKAKPVKAKLVRKDAPKS